MATIFETITSLNTVITDAITAGVATNIPSRIIRNTLIKVSTGKYYEVLPIIVPAECCIIGDELRATNVQPRKASNSSLTPADDFKYTINSLERIETVIGDIVQGVAVTPTTGNTRTQNRTWPYAETAGPATASKQLARTIKRRVDIGLGNKVEANYKDSWDMGTPAYGYAREGLILNKKFIQEEATAYITANYATLKYSRTKCKQDVGFLLDAIAYDLTYGGNWQTVKAGEAYYEGTNLQINSSELVATIATYGYLKSVSQSVSKNTTVSPALNSVQVQLTLAKAGSVAASNAVAALFDDFINILTNGSGSETITYPTTTSVADGLTDASLSLLNVKATVQKNTIDFINGHFGNFQYNSAKCRRDLENIITDTSYDVALGTNYNAVFNGRAYNRPNNAYNLSAQRPETVGAIRNARDELKISVTTDGSSAVGSSNASARITTAYDEIVDMINNGLSAENSLSFPDPGSPTFAQNNKDAKDNLIANKAFIQADVVAYVNNTYGSLVYDSGKCSRDVGYIIDALCYDILYTGTQATTRIAESYFVNGTTQVYGQETETVAAYNHLKSIVGKIVQEQSVTAQSGHAVTQTTPGTPASGTEETLLDAKIDIITAAITAGNLNSLPASVYPPIAWADAEYEVAHSNILSDKEDVITSTVQYINTTYNTTFKYNHAKCSRDIGLLLDAARYDFMLGSNVASINAGLSYLRRPSAKIIGAQKGATIAANEYVRTQLLNAIDSTDNVVGDYWYNFTYNEVTCARDIRLLVDSVRLDVAFNSNHRSIASALRYYSGTVSNLVVLNKQLKQTTESFTKAKTLMAAELSDATAIARSNALWDEIIDIVTNGSSAANAYSRPNPTGYNTSYLATYGNARAQLIANKTFIQDEIDAWIAVQKAASNAPFFPGFVYNATKCRTDVGLIIDALLFDLTYGGNLQTYDAALAYYVGAASQLGGAEKAATLATYARLKIVVEQVIGETGVTKSAGNSGTQDTSGTAGNAGVITFAGNRVQEIIDYIASDGTANPSRTYPGLAWVSGTLQSEYAAISFDVQRQIGNATTRWITNRIVIAHINNSWEWIQDIIFSGSDEGSNTQTSDVEVYNAVRQLELNKEFIVDEALAFIDNKYKAIVTSTVRTVVGTDGQFVIDDTSWLFEGMPIKFVGGDDSSNSVENASLTEGSTYYVKHVFSDTNFSVSAARYGTVLNLINYGEGFTVQKVYSYNRALCQRDVREHIDAIKWDLQWPQEQNRIYNKFGFDVSLYLPAVYRTRLGSRYYVNSVIGSQESDFYYLRNGTGLRLQTMEGLQGDLGPANAYGTSRPTAGAYASLDPGWGPDDTRVWISARSPYVQNCTTFGFGAIGQKIDGALHNGGNDSIVSNDFTQVISDGIGAWITNNGRGELVSVFTYYSHVGYLCEAGGRMRATNGNNSYGKYGSVAEGVDADEIPVTAIVDNEQQYRAVIANVYTDAVNQILALEYSHAGNDYTEAKLDIFGAGDSEVLVQDEFRDQAVNQVRIIEVDDSTGNPDATAGGSGYLTVTNTAQTGSSTSLTIAATDGNSSTAYPGMKIYITSGAGVGLFGVVNTYNSGTKVATVNKETDGTAGWDHVVPGTAFVSPNSSSIYLIEPRLTFAAPSRTDTTATITSDVWNDVKFIETSAQYTNQAVTTQSDGLDATFNVTRNGQKYYVQINTAGTSYIRKDTVTILGSNLGGVTPANDIVITATTVNSATGAIEEFDFDGIGRKGNFIALPDSGTTAKSSLDGATWTTSTLATSADYKRVSSGLVDDGSSTFRQSYAVAVAITGGATVTNYSLTGTTWTAPGSQPSLTATTYADTAFGQVSTTTGRFIIIGDGDRDVSYSDDGGASWTTTTNALPSTGFSAVAYGQGKFVAVKRAARNVAYSTDGITWTEVATGLPAADDWEDIVYGKGRFFAIATDTRNGAYSLDAGATWTQQAITTGGSNAATPVRIEYGQGMFIVTTNDTNELSYSEDGVYWPAPYAITAATYTGGLKAIGFGNNDNDPKFVAIQTGTTTAVGTFNIGCTTRARASVANEKVFAARITEPGSGYGSSAPTMTITDPNNINEALFTVRLNSGVLGQPTFVARGSGFLSASAEVNVAASNGFADFLQDGQFIAVRQLSDIPVNGSNVEFAGLPGTTFKLVNVVSRVGTKDGSYTAFLQLSPFMEIEDAVNNLDAVTMRIRFSQVRLTGHDFLDIGTGNLADTNYPENVYGAPVNTPSQANETLSSNGGRVFFTATDQDGNFRVGDLFSIEQATGVATLNADAFNIAGLQELSLGEVTLGGNSASVTEFSTDPFFTANSDSIVPTQRAIKSYIEAQIGGGGASLIVNSVTAGDIFINGTQITTVSGATINITANVNFTKSVLGLPLAYNYFLR